VKNPKIHSPTQIAGNEEFGKIPTQIIGKSLYFHIPFCQKKCPYCHFYSIVHKKEHTKEFLKHLKIEWDLLKNQVGKKIQSIYFGGGTPCLLGEDLEQILSWIDKDSSCEITLEANPESCSKASLALFRKMGINRLSLGVQSFDDSLLRVLRRTHTAKKALQSIEWANCVGFDNLSIDLMVDLPTQTMKSWETTLLLLRGLPITHLSLYNLTFEPKTIFERKKETFAPLLPNECLSLKILEKATSFLETLGLHRYEISAFAKKGYHSHHNVGYWIGRPFFGLGPSAFSYLEGKRAQNSPNLQHYYQALQKGSLPLFFEEKLPFPENLKELFVVELRLVQGVDLSLFQKKHGLLLKETLQQIDRLQKENLLEEKMGSIRLTKRGLLFYDSIAVALL
jgi:oxygen-independent coproporphyrinogen III oxidase